MNHVFKAIFLTLLSTMTLNSASSQKRVIEIEIKKDPTVDTLIINDYKTNDGVRRYDTISWVIKDPNISKFALKAKRHSNSIFTTNPEKDTVTDRLSLVVAWAVRPVGGSWKYSIVWWDKKGTSFTYDPKIPVKPIIHFAAFVAMIVTIFGSLFYLLYQRRRKANRASKI